MAGNATAVQPVIRDDDAARKLVVLRVLLDRLADELEAADRIANSGDVDLADIRARLSDALMLAFCAQEELAPFETR